MSTQPRFIHLRLHTEYSLLEGAMRLKKLPGLCDKAGMPAVAVTDTNNMFAALEFSVSALGAGIQPIVGCQVDLAYVTPATGEKPVRPAPIVLLAQTRAGYECLMKLNSALYLREADWPHVTLDDLAEYSEGLICLTGGPDGPVGRLLRAGQQPKAEALMTRLAATFGDRLYVELQRHPTETGQAPEAEKLTEAPQIAMAYAMNLPIVATNDVYFLDQKM